MNLSLELKQEGRKVAVRANGKSRLTSRFDVNRFTYVNLGSDLLMLFVMEIILNCMHCPTAS